MKEKIKVLILTGIIAFSACGCGNAKTEEADLAETQMIQKESVKDAETEEGTEDKEQTETAEMETADSFSFADFSRLEFWFASGAGGWATILSVDADGSFVGEYSDGEMGSCGDNYPNGTIYQCDFDGKFSQPVKVNEYTYSVQILDLHYEKEVGAEEIKNDTRYCYSAAYGLDGAEEIMIYLPGAPLTELPEEYRSWVGYYDLSTTSDTELPFYGLYNEVEQCGFSSYDIVEDLKERVASTEEWAALTEADIQNEPFTQTEYNEKTLQLYELWDSALNAVWDVLKRTKDAGAMELLTARQREWIALKEQTVAEAGAEYEGGSMQPMIMNQKAAEMTKERVYELMELLE